jgi:lysophospholipase L1-like esterase
MNRRYVSWMVLTLLASFFPVAGSARDPDKAQPDTVVPVPRDANWMKRQDLINSRAKEGANLVLIGDSITQGWEGAGKEVWAKYYTPRKTLNAGIGGDRTQHVLWRLDHGNIDGLKPKLAVIMIGTNNARDNKPEDTAAGIKAIVEKLRAKLPETKLLILAIFPRGEQPGDPLRLKNIAANEIVKKLADDKNVYYLDIGPKFVNADGTLGREIMPDLLHLSPKGYQIWAESIEPEVVRLMDEK